MTQGTKLAILWHMHQPYYEDLASGEHVLPWVRLHAIKDYWGMVALAREFPRVRLTFNLVPSLLVQIQAFAVDRARDRHLEVGLAPADVLDADARAFLVANGFHAPVDRMIRPYPRYAELHARRRQPNTFSVVDLRDLQVLHKLAWMDPDWLARDQRLAALVARQRDYSEDDKRVLRAVELELLNAVITAYRQTAETGQIELSTSPFYHPIMPLLCDSDVHFRAHPHSALPRHLFARPADAEDQLRRAIELHRSLFGQKPAGVWPSEGSLSDDVTRLIAGQGCRWTATDEEVLARSLERGVDAGDLYRPYEIGDGGGQGVRCLFRDHDLSDLIGFAYQSWDADAAADDFVHRVREAGRRFRASPGVDSGEEATVSVILDGENAWEHYAGGGRPFLRALYRRLEEAEDITTLTMNEAAGMPARPLRSIFPGSWINGDFYIWAGHAEDHRAWAQLAAASAAFDRAERGLAPDNRTRALEELQIAEGSDWFWWYGDNHSSDQDREFDDLFRRHIRNVYAALGEPAPDELFTSNITTAGAKGGPVPIRTLVSPTIDGLVTRFGEWSGAAAVSLGAGGGTMHRVAGQLVRSLQVAADQSDVYLRLDGQELVRRLAIGELGLAVLQTHPDRVRIELDGSAPTGPRWRADEIAEVAIPIPALNAQAGDLVRLYLLVTDAAGHIVEQHPPHEAIELVVPTRHVDALKWVV